MSISEVAQRYEDHRSLRCKLSALWDAETETQEKCGSLHKGKSTGESEGHDKNMKESWRVQCIPCNSTRLIFMYAKDYRPRNLKKFYKTLQIPFFALSPLDKHDLNGENNAFFFFDHMSFFILSFSLLILLLVIYFNKTNFSSLKAFL